MNVDNTLLNRDHDIPAEDSINILVDEETKPRVQTHQYFMLHKWRIRLVSY